MEKLEKVFASKWGLVILYVFIAIVTFALSHTVIKASTNTASNINNVSGESVVA